MPVAAYVPPAIKDAARPLARRVGLAAPATGWWQTSRAVWKGPSRAERTDRWCNVCRWHGSAFLGIAHTESATCPQCGSIARDRFLLWCFTQRAGKMRGARVIETSPRLGGEYRSYMQRWFSYRTSDFDLSAHRGDIQIDLQSIDLPDASVDVVLTPHVLEHVPETRQGVERAVPGDRARRADVPADPARLRGDVGADRAGVPRRQHPGLLQLRLGPDGSGPRRRVRHDGARHQRVRPGAATANSTSPIRTATGSTSTSCWSTFGSTTSRSSPTMRSHA